MTSAEPTIPIVVRLANAWRTSIDATVGAYADALFPSDGPIPVSGSEAGAVEFMRKYISRSPARQRWLLHGLIQVSELGPLMVGSRRVRFTRLSLAERQAFIAEGFRSRVYGRRVVVLAMRALLTMAYFSDARVLAHIGMRHDRDPFRRANEGSVPQPAASGTRLRTGVAHPAEVDPAELDPAAGDPAALESVG